MIDFDELNNLLTGVSAGVQAPECHGFLAGRACIAGLTDVDIWQSYLLAGIDDDAALEECVTVITKLADEIADEIADEEYGFQLLLPDDDEPLEYKSQALSEWCAGFISGLGSSWPENTGMADECNEFLQDLISISRLQGEVDEDDENQAALYELIEYVRMGVMMLYQEWMDNLGMDKPGVLH